MKKPQQKLKLLYLAEYLLKYSDAEHSVTVQNMIDHLSSCGIKAERKSIYDDIECLRLFGLDIETVKNKSFGYYIASREFELPELKLLVDSVQSSKFITHKKSKELISKIETLTNVHNAKLLDRQVTVTNRVKTFNEKIYYNVDMIHSAISNDKKIKFKYFSLDLNKKKEYRKDGEFYIESPVSLSWDDENYYLITYKAKYKNFTHYRVDKMESITIDSEKRILPPKKFDITEYTKSTFSMFGGNDTAVTLEFNNKLIGVIYDRFGVNIPICKIGEDKFRCTVNVAVSALFFSWVMSFGKDAKIVAPENVIAEQIELIEGIKQNYIM